MNSYSIVRYSILKVGRVSIAGLGVCTLERKIGAMDVVSLTLASLC